MKIQSNLATLSRLLVLSTGLLVGLSPPAVAQIPPSAAARTIEAAQVAALGETCFKQPAAQAVTACEQLAAGLRDAAQVQPETAAAVNARLRDVLLELRRYPQAEGPARQAVKLIENWKGLSSREVAVQLDRLADVLLWQGKVADAEPLYRRTLAINESALGKDHPTVAASLHNLAALLKDRGRLGEAEPLYRRVLVIMEAALGKDHPEVATDMSNLALLLQERGKLAEAEPLYRRVLAIRESALGAYHPQVATSLNKLVKLLQERGKLAEAEPLARRALAISEAALGKDHPQIALCVNNLATVLQARGRLEEAEPLFRRALAISKAALREDHPDVAGFMNNLALLLQARGNLGEAEPLFRKALAISEAALGKGHPHVAAAMNNLATLLKDRGNLGEAETLYRRALAIREAALGRDHPEVATTYSDLAVLHLARGQAAPALAALSNTVRIREAALRASPNEDFAAGLLRAQLMEQITISGLPIVLPHNSAALDLAVRSALLRKARTQQLGRLVRQAFQRQLLNQSQKARYAQMQQLVGERAQLLDRPGGKETREQARKLLWQAEQLEQDLAQEMGAASSQSLPGPEQILEAVAGQIPQGSVLIEVVLSRTADYRRVQDWKSTIEDHYLALLVLPDRQVQAIDLGTVDQVHRVVVPFLTALEHRGPEVRDAAQKAYAQLFAKMDLELQSRGIKRLILSPDHALQLIPWTALHDGTQYLADRYSILYVSAGRDLLRGPASVPAQRAVVLADPAAPEQRRLVQARQVSLEVSAQLGVQALLDTQATEANLRDHPNPYTLLVAAHGKYRTAPVVLPAPPSVLSTPLQPEASGPLMTSTALGQLMARSRAAVPGTGDELFNTEEGMHRSALALAPGKDPGDPWQDGMLTAEEVQELHLDATQLVVLLSCEGGRGAISAGQGVYGLRRAFQQAGAETVVSTLWSVDEPSAAQLIKSYYSKLLQGAGNRVGALEEAMKALRRDLDHPEYNHPYYWAPFVVMGADGPLRTPAPGAKRL